MLCGKKLCLIPAEELVGQRIAEPGRHLVFEQVKLATDGKYYGKVVSSLNSLIKVGDDCEISGLAHVMIRCGDIFSQAEFDSRFGDHGYEVAPSYAVVIAQVRFTIESDPAYR